MEFIRINTQEIKILQTPMTCSSCNYHEGIWSYLTNSVTQNMCSLCVLYKTAWGLENKTRIYNFIIELNMNVVNGTSKNEHMDLDKENMLVDIESANRIVLAIVVSNTWRQFIEKTI